MFIYRALFKLKAGAQEYVKNETLIGRNSLLRNELLELCMGNEFHQAFMIQIFTFPVNEIILCGEK